MISRAFINEETLTALEDVACPLGCTRDDQFIVTGRDRLHGLPGKFTVVKCKNCGLMRTNPRPTLAGMMSYYPDDYGPYQSTQVGEQRAALPRRSTLFRWIKSVFAPQGVSQITPPMPVGRMLEIGCASGSFLHRMVGQGWNVEGIEPGAQAAEAARQHGYHVHTGPLETAPEPQHKYDLVTAWMVLEHLHKPIDSLLKLHRWTVDGAWLALSVPDASSWEFTVFANRWHALSLPLHCYHFTPATLECVLRAGGWQLERIFWHGSATNLLKSLRYLAEDHHWTQLSAFLTRLLAGRRLRYPLVMLRRMLQLAHASGRMTVWARRIDA